ncbi:MAG: Hsp20/alpha crystallin family protein [Dehalococcoidia bacterium]|nr:Hsp20/alpha crystallin family protein [Dehalococcoidia bacterium]
MSFRRDWFSTMHQEMERLLDDFSRRKPPTHQFRPSGWEPAVDVTETDTHVNVLVELAGVKKQHVEIAVDRNTLRLRGRRQEVAPNANRSCHRLEIIWGPFERVIPLPAAVVPEETQATFKDGMLEAVLIKVKLRSVQLMVREV